MAGVGQSLEQQERGKRLFSIGLLSPIEIIGIASFMGFGGLLALRSASSLQHVLGLVSIVGSLGFIFVRHTIFENGIQLYPSFLWRARWINWKEIERLRIVSRIGTRDIHDELAFNVGNKSIRLRLNGESIRLAKLISENVPGTELSKRISELNLSGAKDWSTNVTRKSNFSFFFSIAIGCPIAFVLLFYLLRKSANGWDLSPWLLFLVFGGVIVASSFVGEGIWNAFNRRRRARKRKDDHG